MLNHRIIVFGSVSGHKNFIGYKTSRWVVRNVIGSPFYRPVLYQRVSKTSARTNYEHKKTGVDKILNKRVKECKTTSGRDLLASRSVYRKYHQRCCVLYNYIHIKFSKIRFSWKPNNKDIYNTVETFVP